MVQLPVKIHKRKDKGSGAKKYGRNKVRCEQYRREGRREKNKARRIAAQKRKEERKRVKADAALL